MTSSSQLKMKIANAVVALTGYHQFAAGEKIAQPKVKSRMLLWCKAGKGEIRVNGKLHRLETGDFCFLPWDRSIVYVADVCEPFLTGGIHILPYHSRNKRVVFDVAHREEDALANASWRKDVDWPVLAGVKRGSFAQALAFHHLVEYIAHRFQQRRGQETEARALAQCLLRELFEFFGAPRTVDSQIPLRLQQILHYIRHHLHEKISLRDLARFSGLSTSAVGRMFQRHRKLSPISFIICEKINHAKRLLVTSRESVGEVGRRVGIDDPYYFSKLFRKVTGTTPLAHRRESSFF